MSEGLIALRSRRDIAEAQATTWKTARSVIQQVLPAEVLARPDMAALLDTFEEHGSRMWDEARELQLEMEEIARDVRKRCSR